jgi:dienelactone hydrolase
MLSGRRAFQRDSAAETISAILHDAPQDLGDAAVPERLKEIVQKLLEKDAVKRYAGAEEVGADLKALTASQPSRGARLSRGAWIAFAGAVVVLATLASWLFLRDRRIRRAREELLPRAERLLGEAKWRGDYRAAFALAAEAEKIVPDDKRLAPILKMVSAIASFTSEPPGALVSLRPYDDPKAPWESLGVTPIRSVRLPASVFLVRFEKPGYEPVVAAARTFTWDLAARAYRPAEIRRVLDRAGTLPPGMVRVTGLPDLPDYFIDATEVTNRAYKEFVDAGGYRTKEYWKDLLSSQDGTRGWPDAVAGFVDETGRPGPANWQAGDFPAGREQYPVSGVSWYEAAAFAVWAGKSLPTATHWKEARGTAVPAVLAATMSNFRGVGPVPVGSLPSLSAFGAYDMAGNVREWCWNVAPGGRVVRGGAWNDVSYMASSVSRASPFDRSPKNGFRCVKYLDRGSAPASAFEPVKQDLDRPDFYKLRPVPDAVFRVYRDQFAYDRSELGATVEWRSTASRDWVQEKVTFNAAYDGERMAAYLFLPTRGAPPYQTVVYFPGSGSVYQRSSKDLEAYREFEMFLSHFLKSGRAVVYPVYKETFERGSSPSPEWHDGAPTHQYTDLVIKLVKDFRRSLDYLQTRPELDHDRIVYFGFSWGAMYGAIIPAVEERLKASMLVVGGLDSDVRPEVDQFNYVGRVKIPTLMLNGRYDFRFPYESSAKPMYDLLGTPSDQKTQKLYDTDHGVPRNEVVKETLAWLDRFLGPVH